MTLVEDVRLATAKVREVENKLEVSTKEIERHEEQLNGQRGVQAELASLAEEIRGLRKAAYAVAAIIITASIGFAFSVLTVFGGTP